MARNADREAFIRTLPRVLKNLRETARGMADNSAPKELDAEAEADVIDTFEEVIVTLDIAWAAAERWRLENMISQ